MSTYDQTLQLYQELADWHEANGPAHVRDRFLILAADAALSAGRDAEADGFRQRLLIANPHHMLKPFASFTEALHSPDVRSYVEDLRRSYPPELAEEMRGEIRGMKANDGEATVPPVPPTLPVIDMDRAPRSPRAPKAGARRSEAREAEAQSPPTRSMGGKGPALAKPPVHAAASEPPSREVPAPGRLGRLAASRREAPLPLVQPAYMMVSPPSGTSDDNDQRGSSWVASGLLGLTLVAGVGLAAYTLLRPFIPADWLP
jgi:hypothetical protein